MSSIFLQFWRVDDQHAITLTATYTIFPPTSQQHISSVVTSEIISKTLFEILSPLRTGTVRTTTLQQICTALLLPLRAPQVRRATR